MRNLSREGEVRAMLKRAGVRAWEPARRSVAADLMSDAGWPAAVAGCEYVLHIASPFPSTVPKDENELIVPAREGALRVLRARRDAGVKRVVLTSSFAAMGYGHAEPARASPVRRRQRLDESGRRRCDGRTRNRRRWRSARRGISLRARAQGLELAVVNPVGVFGPVLGPDYATSILLVQR